MTIVYILLLSIIVLVIVHMIVGLRSRPGGDAKELAEMKFAVSAVSQNVRESTALLQNEFVTNRAEAAQSSRDQRTETSTQLVAFAQTISESVQQISAMQGKQLAIFSEQLNNLTSVVNEKLASFQTSIEQSGKDGRKEQRENGELVKNDLNSALKDFKDKLRENFSDFEKQQQAQNVASSEKLDVIKNTLESSIKNLQDGNEKKLEEMRNTVDEKLQKTLEARLSQSFEMVSKNLESVQKGLGEMQQLAVGVGDLKKVLTNVKTRGILGEVQLSNILEQMLSPEQYEINCITKVGTANRVEFAIKIPQHQQANKVLLMPIDSKFPIEDYYTLIAAYDAGDQAAAEAAVH